MSAALAGHHGPINVPLFATPTIILVSSGHIESIEVGTDCIGIRPGVVSIHEIELLILQQV